VSMALIPFFKMRNGRGFGPGVEAPYRANPRAGQGKTGVFGMWYYGTA